MFVGKYEKLFLNYPQYPLLSGALPKVIMKTNIIYLVLYINMPNYLEDLFHSFLGYNEHSHVVQKTQVFEKYFLSWMQVYDLVSCRLQGTGALRPVQFYIEFFVNLNNLNSCETLNHIIPKLGM